MRAPLLDEGKTVDTSPLHSAGPVNDHINFVYGFIFWVSVVVFFGVAALIIYSALRFRRKDDDEEPTQVHGNNRLELIWTVIPFGILVTLFTITATQMGFISSAPANSMHVCVVGQRFNWAYYYTDGCGAQSTVPGEEGDTKLSFASTKDRSVIHASDLYIPVGKPVALELVSADVNHSYYIPSLAGQVNAIPGQYNHMWLQADQPGTYYGQCTELCGDGHASMLLKVVALPQPEFDKWMAGKKTAAAGSAGGS